jgi:hypothetical protein
MGLNGKTGYIRAARLRGDFGPLGNDPITNALGRIIGPAVNLTGVDQHYEEVSALANYTIGSRMQVDGRVFYYAKAGGTLVPDLGCCGNYDQAISINTVTDAAAGVSSVVVTVAATDGKAGDGAIAANDLVGGYIVLYHHGASKHELRRITANTVVASGGGTTTITMDRPIVYAMSSDHAEVTFSPYLGVTNPANEDNSWVVGVAQQAATVGQYIWVQTWGPCWLAPQANIGVGAAKHAIFREDGSISLAIYNDATYNGQRQTAGFTMAEKAGAQGAPFFMLQITP